MARYIVLCVCLLVNGVGCVQTSFVVQAHKPLPDGTQVTASWQIANAKTVQNAYR